MKKRTKIIITLVVISLWILGTIVWYLNFNVDDDDWGDPNPVALDQEMSEPVVLFNRTAFSDHDVILLENGSYFLVYTESLSFILKASFSDDLINWLNPYPIFNYNPHLSSDIDNMVFPRLVQNSEGRLFIYYQTNIGDTDTNDQCWITSSINGLNWSEPVEIDLRVSEKNIFLNDEGMFINSEAFHVDGSNIYMSEDGVNWYLYSNVKFEIDDLIQSNNGKYYALTNDGIIYESEDLKDWEKKERVYANFNMELIEDNGGDFIIASDYCGEGDDAFSPPQLFLYYSVDGSKWSKPMRLNTNLYSHYELSLIETKSGDYAILIDQEGSLNLFIILKNELIIEYE